MNAVSAAQDWRMHWTVVLGAAAGVALSTVPAYSTGLMIQPLEQEFGWSRAAITSGKMIGGFIALALTPLVGVAIDRLGPRRIGVTGSVLYCLALAALSQTNSNIWTWWLLWTGMAFIESMVGPTVWTAAVSSVFTRGRGFALAVALCGSAVAATLTPILCDYLVAHHGWRGGYIGLALIWGILTIPVIFCFFRGAKDGRRDRAPVLAEGVATTVPPPELPGYSVREGLRTANFYKLAFAAFLISVVSVSFIANLVPILTFIGHSRTTAAAVAGAVGISAIVGRLSTGYLLDRLVPKKVASVAVALPMLSVILLLAQPDSVAAAIGAAAILGLALGAELDVVAYLASRYLGMRSFGALFGAIAGLISFGVGVGPVVVSYVYDVTQSYSLALWTYIPMSIVTALLLLSLGKIPDFDDSADAVEPVGREV